ncbi:MAG TPA: flagellar assembly protein FliH [Buchnera sp. (in: enterobacteria)]|nr:flagellar assembly protein FliH [Buchnera sp. (in: enterobacteria)]
MSDITSKKIWRKWYPEELSLSQCIKKNTYIIHKDQLFKKNQISIFSNVKKEFCNQQKTEIHKKNCQKHKNKEALDYKVEMENSVLEFKNKQKIVQKKINTFLSDFESALDSLDNVISTRLIHLTLKVTAKIIGENPLIKTSFILNRIKEIIKIESINFCKPKLIIHPDDHDLIKKNFGKMFSMYGWSISCDNRINLGGCKIESEDNNLDATIATLWHELCKLSLCNENCS